MIEIILITKMLLPKIEQISATVQESKGGLEKYPNSIFWDHNQYCASSPNKSKFVKLTEMILTIKKNKQRMNKR